MDFTFNPRQDALYVPQTVDSPFIAAESYPPSYSSSYSAYTPSTYSPSTSIAWSAPGQIPQGQLQQYPNAMDFTRDLPLHAPVPITGESPMLFSDPQFSNHHSSTCSPLQSVPAPREPPPVSAQRFSNVNRECYALETLVAQTFPTPSEMLAGVKTDAIHVDSPHSQPQDTSNRKSRRVAMMADLGLDVSDP